MMMKLYRNIDMASALGVHVDEIPQLLVDCGLAKFDAKSGSRRVLTERGRSLFQSGGWSEGILGILEDELFERDKRKPKDIGLFVKTGEESVRVCPDCGEARPLNAFLRTITSFGGEGYTRRCASCRNRIKK